MRTRLAVAVALVVSVAAVGVVAVDLGLVGDDPAPDPGPTGSPTDADPATSAAGTETGTGTATGTATPTGPTVTVTDENGTRLAVVSVRVADTRSERYTGLSNTETLADGEGMLFVHPSNGHFAYVMRDMDFPLDIVFVAANGTITTIHHAPLPPEGASGGDLTRYRGFGRYVLEVPMGYTNRTGISVGDRVTVPGEYASQ
jgi:hypothetical protein